MRASRQACLPRARGRPGLRSLHFLRLFLQAARRLLGPRPLITDSRQRRREDEGREDGAVPGSGAQRPGTLVTVTAVSCRRWKPGHAPLPPPGKAEGSCQPADASPRRWSLLVKEGGEKVSSPQTLCHSLCQSASWGDDTSGPEDLGNFTHVPKLVAEPGLTEH